MTMQQTLTDEPLTAADLMVTLAQVRLASRGREDGTRIHLHYESIGQVTEKARREALRASELGLPRDRYTGRIHQVWKANDGSVCMNMWVELERNHRYRTFNITKGRVFRLEILGN